MMPTNPFTFIRHSYKSAVDFGYSCKGMPLETSLHTLHSSLSLVHLQLEGFKRSNLIRMHNSFYGTVSGITHCVKTLHRREPTN